MGKSIDDKVVAMSFENNKFEAGIKTTINSLDKLKNSLQFSNSGRGIENVSRAFGHFQLGKVGNAVDAVSSRLSAFHLVAIGVLSNIAASAVRSGAAFIKSFTLGPIIQGLSIYQTKLQAIQTILANTGAAGVKIDQVTKALQVLNEYSNKTIYSFGEMTRNIGTFTAAGVALAPAVSAIKGIANLAALSGSNSQQASTAMYQLSQALAAGQVHLQDWNSVVNAGMGGAVFQRALVETAVALGKIKESSVKLVGPMKNVTVAGLSFRQSLQSKTGQTWLTADVLSKTLATFTGDMTAAQLKTEGFTAAQAKAIIIQGKLALAAATQVKTFSQLIDVTKETVATGWATSLELIIGNLDQAKKLFTGISTYLGNIANSSAAARNKILGDWAKLGGRTAALTALKNVFEALTGILAPFKAAFRDIFPRKTGQDLYDLTMRFQKFTEMLKPSPKTVDELRRTFRGVFAVLDIGKQIISGIVGVFTNLFHTVGAGNGGFLSLTAKIGDFLTSVDIALYKGQGLTEFFAKLTTILQYPIHLLSNFSHVLATMFQGFAPGGFSVKMNLAIQAVHPFQAAIDHIIAALKTLGPAIGNAVQHINWDTVLSVVRTGLLAGIVLMLRRFIGNNTLNKVLGIFGNNIGKGLARNLGGGLLGKLGNSFGSLGGSLKALQNNLKAKTLEEIAIAIALLSVSLLALSMINPKRMSSALSGMAMAFGALIGAMAVIDKLAKGGTVIKLPIIAASFILLAVAIDILTISVLALSRLSWSELSRGLGGLVVMIGALVVASGPLGKNAAGMIRAGVGVTALAIGLNIMALAVKKFGSMDLITMGKGLLGVAGSLIAIAAGMRAMPTGMILQAAALIVIAEALKMMTASIAKFGAMDIKVLGKGLLGVGGGLAAIAIAMQLMPSNMLLISAGLYIVANAIGKIVSAVGIMGKMSIRTLATGIGALAASLGVLALGLVAMSGALAGAVALTITAAAISLLVPALLALGKSSWESIIKGLVGLGAAIGIIALAGIALSPSIPALIGFGAALIAIGAGLTLVGAGVFLLGLGLSSIALAGPAAVDILIHAIVHLARSIGEIGVSVVKGVLQIVQMIAKTAPKFVAAIIVIINALAKAIIKSSPKIAEALVVLIVSALQAIERHAPEIIKAGFNILIDLLKGIDNNIDRVVNMVAKIIVTFIGAIGRNIGKVTKAGAHLLIAIVKGIAGNINRIVLAGVHIVVSLIRGIANNIQRLVVAGGNAIAHFLTGIGNSGAKIVTAGANAMIKFVNALSKNSVKLINAGFKAIINFINGVADSIDKHEPELIEAGFHLGKAIIEGAINGLGSESGNFLNKIKDLGGSAIHYLSHPWEIFSPSRVTFRLGRYIVLGLAKGIDKAAPNVYSSIKNMNKSISDTMNLMQLNTFVDMNPTITPVLDLTEIRKGANDLAGLLNTPNIGRVSLGQATAIASQRTVSQIPESSVIPISTTEIKYEQNITSPKELSAIDIYRQTRNLLSQSKTSVIPS